MNELELINCCLKKEKKAWDIFVQKYSKVIYWAIKKRLTLSGFKVSQDDVNNIFQDVFLSILEGNKLRQIKDAKTISGWLAMIASNKTVDFMRHSIREDRDFNHDISILEDEKSKQELHQKDLTELIGNIINSLPAKAKIIVSLNLLEERSHREIASIMNIPINTVSVTIARTKQKLKQELERKEINL